MSVLDEARILIFRCHQKGLEVLTIDNKITKESKIWKSPNPGTDLNAIKGLIRLEQQLDEKGQKINPLAVEADWYQIPSIRALLKHDIKRLGKKIISKVEVSPEMNFVDIKEALRTALPHEYEALKELKDVIIDRNLSRSI